MNGFEKWYIDWYTTFSSVERELSSLEESILMVSSDLDLFLLCNDLNCHWLQGRKFGGDVTVAANLQLTICDTGPILGAENFWVEKACRHCALPRSYRGLERPLRRLRQTALAEFAHANAGCELRICFHSFLFLLPWLIFNLLYALI